MQSNLKKVKRHPKCSSKQCSCPYSVIFIIHGHSTCPYSDILQNYGHGIALCFTITVLQHRVLCPKKLISKNLRQLLCPRNLISRAFRHLPCPRNLISRTSRQLPCPRNLISRTSRRQQDHCMIYPGLLPLPKQQMQPFQHNLTAHIPRIRKDHQHLYRWP